MKIQRIPQTCKNTRGGGKTKDLNSDFIPSSSSSAEVASSTTPDQSEVSAPAKVNTLSPEASDAESNDTVTEQYDAVFNGTKYIELADAIEAAVSALNNSTEPADVTITLLKDVELTKHNLIGGYTDDDSYETIMIKNGSLTIDFNGHSASFDKDIYPFSADGNLVLFNVSSGRLILKNGSLIDRYPSSDETDHDSLGFWDQGVKYKQDTIIGDRSMTLDHMKVENIYFVAPYQSDYRRELIINSSVLKNCDFLNAPDTIISNSKITGSKFSSNFEKTSKLTFNQCYLKDDQMTFLGAAQFTDTLVENTLHTSEEKFQVWNWDLQKGEEKIGTSFDQVTLGERNYGYEIQDDNHKLSAATIDQMKSDPQKNQYLFTTSATFKIQWNDNKDHSKDNIDVTINYPKASSDVMTSINGNDATTGVTVAVPNFTINGYDEDSFKLETTPTNINDIQVQYKMSEELKDLYDFTVQPETDETGHITINLVAAKKEYTISYDPAGGTWADGTKGVKTVSDVKDSAQTILPAPSRPGYTFQYWKGSRFNPGQTYDQTNTYGHYTDHQLTAVWAQNTSPVASAVPAPSATPVPSSVPVKTSKSTATTSSGNSGNVVKPLVPKTSAGANIKP